MSLAPEESSDARCDLPGAVSSNGLVISPPTDAVDFESSESSRMNSLVARTGRHQQRYECGYRLVAGCVPFRYKSENAGNGDLQQTLEVLMVSTQGGPGLLFPKGGWETDETVEEAACREALEEAGVKGQLTGSLGLWDFKSKRQQGDYSPEGLCRAHMFALAVTEELDTWPEQHSRQRQWFNVAEAIEHCRYQWMRGALDKCISYLGGGLSGPLLSEDGKDASGSD